MQAYDQKLPYTALSFLWSDNSHSISIVLLQELHREVNSHLFQLPPFLFDIFRKLFYTIKFRGKERRKWPGIQPDYSGLTLSQEGAELTAPLCWPVDLSTIIAVDCMRMYCLEV